MKIGNIKGMSLVEIMVATLILAFIMAGLYTTLLAGNVSWQSHSASVRALQETRKAISAITLDLRVGDSLILSQGATSLSLSFSHPGDGSVSYSWATTGDDANQIIRQTSTTTRILAQDISAFSLLETPDDVTIDITSTVTSDDGQVESFSLKKTVAKR